MIILGSKADVWEQKTMTEHILKQFVVWAGNLSPDQIDAQLERANKAAAGFGVEAIKDQNTWHNFYGDTIALYVNTGETYSPTLLYDVGKDELFFISWGDWFEAWEADNAND